MRSREGKGEEGADARARRGRGSRRARGCRWQVGRTVAGGSLAGVLSDAGEMGRARVGRPREKRSSRWREGKEVRGLSGWASASEEGSWARVGFSWARQVGPSAGFELGFQGSLGWA